MGLYEMRCFRASLRVSAGLPSAACWVIIPRMTKERGNLLYRKVYQTLRGRILSGEYEPGDRIETEQELTVQLKASVITIRQAEQMLVDEGLLDKQRGRGTFVSESARQHLKILGVCGLDLAQGFQHRLGPYFSDLIVLSQEATARRGIEFETVCLPSRALDRARHYCEDSTIREYRGFLFMACSDIHPLLLQVRKLGLRYARITGLDRPQEPRRVWLDYHEAIRLALAQFAERKRDPVLIMGIGDLQATVNLVLEQIPRRTRQVYFREEEPDLTREISGYRRMLELVNGGQVFPRIIFLDDVVALGATRALLKAGFKDTDVELVVITGQREMIPLGFPTTFVVHDTKAEVDHAFDILEQKQVKGETRDLSWRSGFRVVPATPA